MWWLENFRWLSRSLCIESIRISQDGLAFRHACTSYHKFDGLDSHFMWNTLESCYPAPVFYREGERKREKYKTNKKCKFSLEWAGKTNDYSVVNPFSVIIPFKRITQMRNDEKQKMTWTPIKHNKWISAGERKKKEHFHANHSNICVRVQCEMRRMKLNAISTKSI